MSKLDDLTEETFTARLFAVESGQAGNGVIDVAGDFSIPFAKTIDRVRAVQLINYNIPYSWFNVSSSNNSLTFTDAGLAKTVSIPVGQYNLVSAVCSALAQAMTVASAGTNVYTLTTSPISQKITITGSLAAFTVAASSTIKSVIGLGDVDIVAAGPFTALMPNSYNLLPITELQIQLPALVRNLDLVYNNDSATTVKTISLSSYSFGQYMTPSESGGVYFIAPCNLSGITVRIVSGEGWCPEFDPHLPITVEFRIYRVK